MQHKRQNKQKKLNHTDKIIEVKQQNKEIKTPQIRNSANPIKFLRNLAS